MRERENKRDIAMGVGVRCIVGRPPTDLFYYLEAFFQDFNQSLLVGSFPGRFLQLTSFSGKSLDLTIHFLCGQKYRPSPTHFPSGWVFSQTITIRVYSFYKMRTNIARIPRNKKYNFEALLAIRIKTSKVWHFQIQILEKSS